MATKMKKKLALALGIDREDIDKFKTRIKDLGKSIKVRVKVEPKLDNFSQALRAEITKLKQITNQFDTKAFGQIQKLHSQIQKANSEAAALRNIKVKVTEEGNARKFVGFLKRDLNSLALRAPEFSKRWGKAVGAWSKKTKTATVGIIKDLGAISKEAAGLWTPKWVKKFGTVTGKVLSRGKDYVKLLGNTTKKTFTKMGGYAKRFGGILKRAMKAGVLPVAIGGAIAGAFAVSSINSAKDYSKAIGEVSTISSYTRDELKSLSKQILKTSIDYNQSPLNTAKGAYQAISAGVDQKELGGFMKTAGALSMGGVAEMGEAVDLLTNGLNAYGYETKAAGRLSDMFFETVRLGKTTIGELAAQLGKVASPASSAGVEMNELLGSVATLTKVGLSTDIATTQIRAMMTAITKPTPKAAAVAKKLGIEFNLTAVKTMGFVKWMEQLRKKTGGSNEVIAQLFGNVRAQAGVLNIVNAGWKDFVSITEQVGTASGTTQEAVKKMLEQPGVKFDQLLTTVKAFSVTLGTDIMKGVVGFVDNLGGVENLWYKIQEYFNEFKGFLASVIEQMLSGLSRAMVPLGEVLSKYVSTEAGDQAFSMSNTIGNYAVKAAEYKANSRASADVARKESNLAALVSQLQKQTSAGKDVTALNKQIGIAFADIAKQVEKNKKFFYGAHDPASMDAKTAQKFAELYKNSHSGALSQELLDFTKEMKAKIKEINTKPSVTKRADINSFKKDKALPVTEASLLALRQDNLEETKKLKRLEEQRLNLLKSMSKQYASRSEDERLKVRLAGKKISEGTFEDFKKLNRSEDFRKLVGNSQVLSRLVEKKGYNERLMKEEMSQGGQIPQYMKDLFEKVLPKKQEVKAPEWKFNVESLMSGSTFLIDPDKIAESVSKQVMPILSKAYTAVVEKIAVQASEQEAKMKAGSLVGSD